MSSPFAFFFVSSLAQKIRIFNILMMFLLIFTCIFSQLQPHYCFAGFP